MERFSKIVFYYGYNGFQTVNYFCKRSFLDIRQGSEYGYEENITLVKKKKVLSNFSVQHSHHDLEACNFIRKRQANMVFHIFEYCKIFKNSFFL